MTAGIVLALALALFIARAPTAYTGGLPVVGDYVPLKLNAVYIIVFGPLLAFIASIYIWAALRGRRRKDASDSGFFGAAFIPYVLLLGLLSLQYFIVIAPEGHCDRLPNYDFLWKNEFGDTRIVHCMSGTAEINKETPFYLRQQILQSWAMFLFPAGAAAFFINSWIRMRRR